MTGTAAHLLPRSSPGKRQSAFEAAATTRCGSGVGNIDHGGRLVADRAIPGRSARHSSRRSVKGRAPAKGEGGDGWARHHEFMMRERPHRAPNACVLPQGRSICSTSRRGASLEWERQACPPHCKRVSCDGVRCMQPPVVRRAGGVLRLTLNNAPPSPWSPLATGSPAVCARGSFRFSSPY